MRSLLVLPLFIACILCGCSEQPELRVDDFRFGSRNTGMTSANPTFKVGEKVFLSYAIRGFTPDAAGNAKISHKITLTGVEQPLCEVTHESFKINSEITSFGPPKPDEMVFSEKQVGEGVLTFLVVDEVAEKTLLQEYPYKVTP